MVELADALDLGSSEETYTGSIPASCTNLNEIVPQKLDHLGTIKWRDFYY